jgi:hypothetical protein
MTRHKMKPSLSLAEWEGFSNDGFVGCPSSYTNGVKH